MSILKRYLKQKPIMRQAVVGYMVKNNKVLLGLRKKVELQFGKNLFAGIGGKIQGKESSKKALMRELGEEIEVRPILYKKVGEIVYLFPHQPRWNQKVIIFLIKSWQGVPRETTVIRPQWFSLSKLPQKNMWPDNILTIPKILTGKEIKATFLYSKGNKIEEYILTEIWYGNYK